MNAFTGHLIYEINEYMNLASLSSEFILGKCDSTFMINLNGSPVAVAETMPSEDDWVRKIKFNDDEDRLYGSSTSNLVLRTSNELIFKSGK